MKSVIFGANGQDGHYLSALCNERGIQAVGTSRTGEQVRCDVSSYEQVEKLIRQESPDYVFHLAANSTTRHDALFENHETISTGTLNVLESVKRYCPNAKVFITGSGLQFRNDGTPISEDTEFDASSLYSVARIQSVYAARYYRSKGLKAYVGYLFHHESPRRKASHVSQQVALAVKRIAQGSNEILEVGDISVQKEWTFAGDVAKGILTLMNQDYVFEATIGSGKAYSIENWLEQCFNAIGKNWKDYVQPRPGFTPEYHRLVSNPRTMNALDWSAKVDLPELAVMMTSQGS